MPPIRYIVHRGAYHFLKRDNTEEKRMFLGDFLVFAAVVVVVGAGIFMMLTQ